MRKSLRQIDARGKWFLAITMAAAVAALAVAGAFWMGHQRWLARYWGSQLDTVPDDEAAGLLARIGQLDEAGLPVLVAALGSRREAVASGARRVLAEHQERWENLPWGEVSPRLAVLAESLAECAPTFTPAARRDAEQLASWILRWRPQTSTAERLRMVVACERVLMAAAEGRWPDPSGAQDPLDGWHGPAGAGTQAATAAEPGGLASARPLGPGPTAGDFPPLPGGSLSPETAPAKSPAGGTGDDSRLAGAQDGQAGEEAISPRYGSNGAAPAGPRANAPAALPDSAGAAAGRLRPAPAAPTSDGDSGGNQRGALDPAALQRTDTLELMRRLRDAGGDDVARIRAELARRGFSEVHLELARRLFDPDPQVRLELARRLPGLQSVDAEPWLLWLCEDGDAEVRAAAMALLATTRDPALLRRVERMAERDGDARVRRQAERLRQERDQRTR